MWFVSSFIDLKIYDIAQKYVGVVQDLLFSQQSSDYPKIEFLLIKVKSKQLKVIDFSQIEAMVPNDRISLECSAKGLKYKGIDPKKYVSMRHSVLDQQIVDVKNAHVIRVNDVKLGFVRGDLKVLGIDISFSALMRRMGFRNFHLFGLFRPLFIDWQQIQILEGESIKINTMAEKLKKIHPADLADIIEKINSTQRKKILESLEEETVARIIEEADDDARKQIIQHTSKSDLKEIFENMDTDDVVDVIQDLPIDLQNKVTSTFDEVTKKEIVELSNYEEDTVGGLMATDFIEVSQNLTVEQAISYFKEVSADYRSALYLYVLDDDGKLRGSVSARSLICSDSQSSLKDICKEIPAKSLLQIDQSAKEVVAIMTKYNLYNAAVGDENGVMIGLVSIDDVLRHLYPDV